MFFKPNRVGWSLAALACATTATPALAATQGALGTTSTGSIVITVQVASRVQITALNDVTFTGIDPSVTATNAQSNCVWSNTATKGYTITATGGGTGGAFTLRSGSLTPVTYTVQWNQSTGQTSGTALTAGTASGTFNSTATTPTCATAPATTSSLIVTIPSAQLLNMASLTNYSDTLTLLVSPV